MEFDSQFWVSKDLINKKQIIKDLRVQSNKGFNGTTLTLDCFESKDDIWGVPIPYAAKQGWLDEAQDNTPKIEMDWPDADVGYRHNQKEVEEKTLQCLKKDRACRVQAEVSFGKSVMTLKIAKELQTNCLVICPSNEIKSQFISTAKELFGVKAGVIAGKKEEVGLVTVTTYQTLARRIKDGKNAGNPNGVDYFNKFGLLVIDEAHLAGNASLTQILRAINSTYRLSVSAEFYRGDGLVKALEVSLGEIAAIGKKDEVNPRVLYTPYVGKLVDMNKAVDRTREFSQSVYRNLLAESEKYNDYLIELCQQILDLGDRRILVYIRRIAQAEILHEKLGEKSSLFLGTTKDKDLKDAATKDIILYSKSAMGLDMQKFLGEELENSLKPLNTVIITSPMTCDLQIVGRVGRTLRGPETLIVIPQIDDYFAKALNAKNLKKNHKNTKRIKSLKELK